MEGNSEYEESINMLLNDVDMLFHESPQVGTELTPIESKESTDSSLMNSLTYFSSDTTLSLEESTQSIPKTLVKTQSQVQIEFQSNMTNFNQQDDIFYELHRNNNKNINYNYFGDELLITPDRMFNSLTSGSVSESFNYSNSNSFSIEKSDSYNGNDHIEAFKHEKNLDNSIPPFLTSKFSVPSENFISKRRKSAPKGIIHNKPRFENFDLSSSVMSESNEDVSISPRNSFCYKPNQNTVLPNDNISKNKFKVEDISPNTVSNSNNNEDDNDGDTDDTNTSSERIFPNQLESIEDIPRIELAQHRCEGCFKVSKNTYGCIKQIIDRLPNLKSYREYNTPNNYSLEFVKHFGNKNFEYLESEVKTLYDPMIKRYITEDQYNSKGKKIKRDYPSLCPFCKVTKGEDIDSLFYERNNSCYRGHLINTHGINTNGQFVKLPKSGFIGYKMGKNCWIETFGFRCQYDGCDMCFLRGDKSHGFHEYIRHWSSCHE